MDEVHRRLLTFGRNKYSGGNSLNGCVNDTENTSNKLKYIYPDFDTRIWTDYNVTASNYIKYGTEALKTLKPGSVILMMADSCFSETFTKLYQSNPGKKIKNRLFYPGFPARPNIKSRVFRGSEMYWIEMSACGEHETAADAYVNKEYCGIFTYYAMALLQKEMTYREWHQEICTKLPGNGFDQQPHISGPDYLLDKKVFEDQTLIIHNSSHGSYTYDRNGDEEDGQDEGLYFDRLLLDDEVNNMLKTYTCNVNNN
jgi:hypothetical protein